ncbi:MAG: hypothetical protein V7752_18495 [Halopseudomonas sp.]
MSKRMKSGRPLSGIFTSLCCCVLVLSAHPIRAADSTALLKQSHTIQIAASDLLTELYLTEHSILFPRNDLVMVMFSQIQGARIFLHYAEFYINDELIETYQYPMPKVEMLAHHRAVQPMFTTLLPSGEHSIKVRIYGLAMGGNRYVEAEKVIRKADKPLFLLLNNGFREVEVTEWQ